MRAAETGLAQLVVALQQESQQRLDLAGLQHARLGGGLQAINARAVLNCGPYTLALNP